MWNGGTASPRKDGNSSLVAAFHLYQRSVLETIPEGSSCVSIKRLQGSKAESKALWEHRQAGIPFNLFMEGIRSYWGGERGGHVQDVYERLAMFCSSQCQTTQEVRTPRHPHPMEWVSWKAVPECSHVLQLLSLCKRKLPIIGEGGVPEMTVFLYKPQLLNHANKAFRVFKTACGHTFGMFCWFSSLHL